MFCTTRRSASTATLGTQSMSHSGSVSVWLMVGGMKPSRMASVHAMAANALAAPMVWPIIDLIETVRGVLSPKTCRMARDSLTSLAFVPVPWAEMRSTSSAEIPALS